MDYMISYMYKTQYERERTKLSKSLGDGQYLVPNSGIVENAGYIPYRCRKFYKKDPLISDIEKLRRCLGRDIPNTVIHEYDKENVVI